MTLLRTKTDLADGNYLPGAPPAAAGPSRKTIFFTLDGIRGVAALLVVMRHAGAFFVPWQARESYLAVDIFFVLSGVVIAQAYGQRLRNGALSWREFAWVRLVRIMPLYLLGTAISVGAAIFGFFDFGSPRLLGYYAVLALFMIPNPGIGTPNVFPLNNPAWTLPLELIVNGLYARFVTALSLRRILAIMAFSLVGIGITVATARSHSLNIGFWARSFPFGFCRVGYSFFAGVLLYRWYPALSRHGSNVRNSAVLAWIVLIATALILTAAPPAAAQRYYDFFCVAGLFPLLVCAGMLVQPSGRSAHAFRFLGLISYAVYTLHAPLSGVVDAVLKGGVERHAPCSGIVFLLTLGPLCAAADKYYDFPVRRFLLGMRRGGNSRRGLGASIGPFKLRDGAQAELPR